MFFIATNLATDYSPAIIAAIMMLPMSSTMADSSLTTNTTEPENGIEIGALTFIGTDLRIYHRDPGSRYLLGIRYIDYEEDFINESLAGLPNDSSDKLRTTRFGAYVDYQFDHDGYYNSFFATIALLQTKKELKCNYETNSSSATGLYFGGGYRGSFSNHFGYTIGIVISPFVNLNEKTTTCESDEGGDFDLNFGLSYKF